MTGMGSFSCPSALFIRAIKANQAQRINMRLKGTGNRKIAFPEEPQECSDSRRACGLRAEAQTTEITG